MSIPDMKKLLIALVFVLAVAPAYADDVYVWDELTEAAPFPGSYNYPVHVAPNGRFIALHPHGTWTSTDGSAWAKSALPFSGMNSAYLAYVQYAGATWSLGKLRGNYQGFEIEPIVQRTSDYKKWQTVGQSSSLPPIVFYAAASFRGAMWILGGFNGREATAEIWRSTDGLVWTRVVNRAPWSPRAGAKAVVFQDRLYMLGGGIIDGAQANDVWSSADGSSWRRETEQIAPERPMGTPIVFDGKLWLVGANRSGAFSSAMAVSNDGKTWRAQVAPWSPRGGVAVWTDGRNLYVTGGKYSYVKNGETVFVYSNDVWRMRRK